MFSLKNLACKGLIWRMYTQRYGVIKRNAYEICSSISVYFHCWYSVSAIQVTSHYQNQWWPSLLKHICITHLQWFSAMRYKKNKLEMAWGVFHQRFTFLQNILLKFVYCRNPISYENFKLKLCCCAQSHTKFELEILTINVITGIVYFHKIILESSLTKR